VRIMLKRLALLVAEEATARKYEENKTKQVTF
jgi:hypothetical protein